MRLRVLPASALLAVVLCGGAAAQSPTLDGCRQEVADAPADFNAYRCFDRLSRVPGGKKAGVEHLEATVTAEPENTHALTMLARLLDPRQPRPLELLGKAIEGYTGSGDRNGLAWASIYRSRVFMIQYAIDDADRDAESAAQLAIELDDYPLLAMCRFQQSRIASLRGDDGTLFSVLRSIVLDTRFETLSPNFKAAVLQNLGSVCGELNLHDTAMGYLREAEELALEHDLGSWLYDARYSMSSVAMRLFHQGAGDRDTALAFARGALEAAGRDWQRAMAEMRIAELTAGDEGIRMLRELAESGGFEPLTALGLRLLTGDRERISESIEPLEKALDVARGDGFARNLVRALSNLGIARLESEPAEDAIESALRAMDAIEGLHDLQTGETIGAMNFAVYSQIYYTTIGKLLSRDDGQPTFEEIDRAFGVSERLRSRSLFEHLARSDDGSSGDAERAAVERREVLGAISELQVKLVSSGIDGEARARAERELEGLEEREVMLRAEIDQASPARAIGGHVSIESIQRELRGDEALLSFLLSTPGSGGSWLLVVTSTGVSAHALPSRTKLENAVEFWLGLVQRGDGSERIPAAALYEDLLAEALETLPAGVHRLILLPDGPLHRMPFDALRAGAGDAPVVEWLELTRAPSAGIWLRLRRQTDTAEAGALILADPEFPRSAIDDADLRAFRLADVSVGRLPFARDEARQAVRSLGDGELRTGADASEAFVKGVDLGSYRVLHFAAHALIDEDNPDRSAILLAPGNETEDGLLQAREVLDLDLRGAMVTLSACRSAGGRVVTGEGVMGLARSFFQARASVVVGSLWPLRDEVTSRLMASFYRGLGEGLPTGAAMSRAKRELHAAGLPASAWAGVVVLGDGGRSPWPEGSASGSGRRTVGIAIAAVVAGAALLLVYRRRAVG